MTWAQYVYIGTCFTVFAGIAELPKILPAQSIQQGNIWSCHWPPNNRTNFFCDFGMSWSNLKLRTFAAGFLIHILVPKYGPIVTMSNGKTSKKRQFQKWLKQKHPSSMLNKDDKGWEWPNFQSIPPLYHLLVCVWQGDKLKFQKHPGHSWRSRNSSPSLNHLKNKSIGVPINLETWYLSTMTKKIYDKVDWLVIFLLFWCVFDVVFWFFEFNIQQFITKVPPMTSKVTASLGQTNCLFFCCTVVATSSSSPKDIFPTNGYSSTKSWVLTKWNGENM